MGAWYVRIACAAMAVLLAGGPTTAQQKSPEKIKVVATFSILADLVKNVGGDRVEVASLVGPNGDVHVYTPTPSDAKAIAAAAVVFMNGLGLEGWIERLVKASGTKAAIVVATAGIKPRAPNPDSVRAGPDPHAWQSVANAQIYVANIRDALAQVDPAGKGSYETNARSYLAKLAALERTVTDAIAKIPIARRKVITAHDAFGYFGSAYNIAFIASQGVSTESEPSAKDVARLITQIKIQNISAVFLENVADPRLIERIAGETGAKIGGTLYSDALTDMAGPAPTYIDMIRHNVRELVAALAG
jgi:zinc/manganese transport system substrate-binding protein